MNRLGIEKLASLGSPEELIKVQDSIKQFTNEQVCEWIETMWPGGINEAVTGLFMALPSNEMQFISKREAVVTKVFQLFAETQDELPERQAKQLTSDLQLQIIDFSVDYLVELSEKIVNILRRGECANVFIFDLLPRCLQLIITKGSLLNDSVFDGMNGESFKDHIIHTICQLEWYPSFCLGLVSSLKYVSGKGLVFKIREIDVNSNQLRIIIGKIIELLPEIPLNDLPPVIYQLLVLSTRGYKDKALFGIIEFLDSLKKNETLSDREISNFKGTILLHILTVTKQDHSLGKEFFKMVKSTKGLKLTSTLFAVLVIFIQTDFLHDASIDIIKSTLTTSFKRKERLFRRPWMKDFVDSNYEELAEMFTQLARDCARSWDQVTEGMVKLCFNFMDFSVAGIFSRKACTDLDIDNDEGIPQYALRNLSIKSILYLFQHQEMVRTTILNRIVMRMISKYENNSPSLLLWKQIVSTCLEGVMPNLNIVRETFEYLCFLPLPKATLLFESLVKVAVSNSDVLNSLVLIFKKGLFHRDSDVKMVACLGNVLLLKQVCNSGESDIDNDLPLEIVQNLKKVFRLDIEIQRFFFDLLSTLTPSQLIFDFVLDHFSTCIQENAASTSPFDFSLHKSIPLPNIISLMSNLLIFLKNTSDDPNVLITLNMFTATLLTKASQMDIEEYDLVDKDIIGRTDDFSLVDSIRGSFEALIEFCIFNGLGAESAQIIGELLDKIASSKLFLEETKTKMKRSKFMSIRVCKSLFQIVCGKAQSPNLRDVVLKHSFAHKVVISATNQTLSKVLFDRQKGTDIGDICFIFQTACDYIFNGQDLSAYEMGEFVDILRICLEIGLKQSFLDMLITPALFIKKFFDFFVPVISRELSTVFKNIGNLLLTIGKIIEIHPLPENDCRDCLQMVTRFLKEFSVDDSTFLKGLLNVFTCVQSTLATWEELLEMSLDVKRALGSIHTNDSEQELLEIQQTFGIINKCNSAHFCSAILSSTLHFLDDIEWLLTTGNLSVVGVDDDHSSVIRSETHSDVDEVIDVNESKICKNVVEIIQTIARLQSTQVPDQIVDSIFINLGKIFKILLKLVKSKFTHPENIGDHLVKVIAAGSAILTPGVYLFITFIQTAEIERAKRDRESGKVKKRTDKTKKSAGRNDKKRIPQLIYDIEQYENHLIKLSKKTNTDITKYCKRSTSRDFKIEINNLPSSEEEDDNEEADEEENIKPVKKLKI